MTGIEFHRTAGGARWLLPRRELGHARWVGIGAVVMGVFVLGFMTLWVGMPLSSGLEMLRKGQGFGWLLVGFALLGLPMLVIGLGMIGVGLGLVSNRTHAEVEIRNGYLIGIERVMGLKWKRKRKITEVERLVIGPGLPGRVDRRRSSSGAADAMTSAFQKAGGLVSLRASGSGMKELVIAPGYSAEVLREVAETLSRQMEVAGQGARRVKLVDDGGEEERRVKVVVDETEGVEASMKRRDAELAAAKPDGTKIVLEHNVDGLSMTIPPTGLMKNKAGLFTFGLIWCSFMAVFTVLMGSTLLFGQGQFSSDLPGIWGPVVAVLFILVFWGIGIGMLLAGWNMAKRIAMIDVVGDTLLVTRSGLFGTRQMEWRAAEIASIAMGPSEIESNDVPIMALVIEERGGKATKLMTGRPHEELEWTAAVLRGAMKVRGDGGDDIDVNDADGTIDQPAGSKVGVERMGEEVRLVIPGVGLGKALPMLLIGFVFAGIGLGVMGGVLWSQLMTGRKSIDWTVVGFILLWGTMFAGGGLLFFCMAMSLLTRRFAIVASPGRMRIVRRGWLGEKVYDWPAQEIAGIDVSDSGTKTGNTSWYQLRITHCGGKKMKVGTGREVEELRWMVWELRRAVKIADREAASGSR